MPERELFLLFVRPLNRLGLRYFVSGSVASILYGEPRLTNDVDVVIFLKGPDIFRLAEAFPASEFYVPAPETIRLEIERPENGMFNVLHASTGFKADFYAAARDEFDLWALQNVRRIEYQGETFVVAPVEYVIVRKLQYFREGGSEKHLRDIRGILRVSSDQIDHANLNDWIGRIGVRPEWKKIQ